MKTPQRERPPAPGAITQAKESGSTMADASEGRITFDSACIGKSMQVAMYCLVSFENGETPVLSPVRDYHFYLQDGRVVCYSAPVETRKHRAK